MIFCNALFFFFLFFLCFVLFLIQAKIERKNRIYHRSPMQTDKSQPDYKRTMTETKFTEGWDFSVCIGDQSFDYFFLPMRLKNKNPTECYAPAMFLYIKNSIKPSK